DREPRSLPFDIPPCLGKNPHVPLKQVVRGGGHGLIALDEPAPDTLFAQPQREYRLVGVDPVVQAGQVPPAFGTERAEYEFRKDAVHGRRRPSWCQQRVSVLASEVLSIQLGSAPAGAGRVGSVDVQPVTLTTGT